MIYPSIGSLLKKFENRYYLVIATAKEARDIVDEAQSENVALVEKPIKLAIERIAKNPDTNSNNKI